MKRLLFPFLFALCLAPVAARASTCTVPNTFTNGTTADANQVNANFSALQTCGNNVDNTQIGTLGIYASQIKPTTGAQATFGGTFGYTFNPSNTGQVPLTISNAASPTVDYLDVQSSGGIKYLYVDKNGILNTNQAPSFGGVPSWTGALPVVQGGTGSTTQNFVDLSSAQTIGGAKTFTSAVTTTSLSGFVLPNSASVSTDVSGNLYGNANGSAFFSFGATGGNLTLNGTTKSFLTGSSTYGPTSATVPGLIYSHQTYGNQAFKLDSGTVSNATGIGAVAAASVSGVSGVALSINDITTNTFATIDASGNFGTLGYAAHKYVTSAANGSTLGAVAPCYTAAGANCGNGVHTVVGSFSSGNVGCSSSSYCINAQAISLTGAAQFTSVPFCSYSSNLGGQYYATGIASTTTVTVYVYNPTATSTGSGVTTAYFICTGT